MIHGDACTEQGPVKALSPVAWFAIGLAFLPFVAKRIALLGHPDVAYWLAWDYSARCVSLLGVMLAYRCGIVGASGVRARLEYSVTCFLAALVLGLLEQWVLYPWFGRHLRYFEYFHTPFIRDPSLLVFDLVAGVALVAVSEEFLFRRLLFALLARLDWGSTAIVLASSALFALVHLTAGLADTVNAFVFGLLFGTVFYTTQRLSLSIALHFIEDFLVFWWRAGGGGA